MFPHESETRLKSFCEGKMNKKLRIGHICLYKAKYSLWSEKVLMIIEYTQLFSQIINIHLESNTSLRNDRNLFVKAVVYFSQLTNPSYLLHFSSLDSVIPTLFTIILAVTLLKYIFSVCIWFWYHKESWCFNLIIRWLFRTQARIVCFYTTSFFTQLLFNLPKEHIRGINNAGITLISLTIIGIEFIFSFLLLLNFNYLLPTKSFSSAKDSKITVINLTQKLFCQILALCFRKNPENRVWVICSGNLIWCILRSYHFYRTLPLYNFQALFFEGVLISVVNSFTFSTFLGLIIKFNSDSLNFTVITAIILSILFGRISYQWLAQMRINLLLGKINGLPELLVHKISASWQMGHQLRIPGPQRDVYHWTYLLSSIEHISFKENGTDQFIVSFLEKVSHKYPQNLLVQLFLAEVCSKNLRQYAKAIRIITELKQKTWNRGYLTCQFLLKKIRNTFLQEIDESVFLDINEYIRTNLCIDQLKEEICQQIDMKTKICQNILSKTPDIGEIYNLAQTLDCSRTQTLRKMDAIYLRLPENCLQPLFLCAEYHNVLNYSYKESLRLNYLATQRTLKYQKNFDDPHLTQESLYHNKNAFLLISVNKNSLGHIICHSKALLDICGTNEKSYNGTHTSTIFPQSLQNYYHDLISGLFEKGEMHALNKTHRSFISHRDGYLIEVELYLQIHPDISENLYLNMIIRPTSSFKDHFLLKENGVIEGITKSLYMKLPVKITKHLLSRTLTVDFFAHELLTINQACNLLKDQAYLGKNIDFEDFQNTLEKHELYPLQKEFKLMSSDQENSQLYQVNARVFCFEPIFLKLFELEKINRSNISEYWPSSAVKTQRRKRVSPFRQFKAPRKRNTKFDELNLRSQSLATEVALISARSNQNEFETENTERKLLTKPEEDDERFLFHLESSVNSSHFQNDDLDEDKDRAFHLALKAKYYSKSFILLCLLFYSIITATGVSQVVLKGVSDSTFGDLMLKKDLLKYAQFRTYNMVKTEIAMTGIFLYLDHLVSEEIFGNGAVSFLQLFENAYNYITLARSYNQQIISGVDYLDEETKKQLYEKNVRIFGTYQDYDDRISQTVTTFETVDKIFNAIFHLIGLSDKRSVEAYQTVLFADSNILNDFIIQDNKMRDLFTNSVQTQKHYFQLIITLCLAITPVLLLFIGLVLALIIYRQYNLEKHLLVSFLKLNLDVVEKLLSKLQGLKKCLLSQQSLENIKSTHLTETLFMTPNMSIYHKNQTLKVVKTSVLKKRYCSYLLKVLFYTTVLNSIMIWNYASAQKSLDEIYLRQDQLQTASALGADSGFIYTVSADCFINNNTVRIENSNPLAVSIKNLKYLRQVPESFREVFRQVTPTTDPEIYQILYENTDCSKQTGNHQFYCLALINSGGRTDIFSALSNLYTLLTQRIALFESLYRTQVSNLYIVNSSFATASPLLLNFETIAGNCELLANILSTKIEKLAHEAESSRLEFLIFFLVSLIIVSFLYWIQILKELGEVDNNFKKVLQIFPARLILANFVLKTFLTKTSKNGSSLNKYWQNDA